MESLTLVLCSILAFCLAFYLLVNYFRPYARLKAIGEARRVLLVVSHPDDESMFFGPTLLNLCRTRPSAENVFLLCMSNGDFRGNGEGVVRKHELYAACNVLGLPEENITILRYRTMTYMFFEDSSQCGQYFNIYGKLSFGPNLSFKVDLTFCESKVPCIFLCYRL